jgi:hypothetical protein
LRIKQASLNKIYFSLVNGNFAEWSAWSACSKSCGDGKSTRSRKCESPSPKFGGKSCAQQGLGPSEERQKCNVKDCQGMNCTKRFENGLDCNQLYLFTVSRDGGYSHWTAWTGCSMSCGAGTTSRYRACDNPRQQGTGKDCTRLGTGTQTIPCFNMECPSKLI